MGIVGAIHATLDRPVHRVHWTKVPWLRADGIVDKGFYVQAAFYPIKQRLEVYGATSWVFGDKDAGFGDAHEYLGGANLFWFPSRNVRSNIQLIHVDRSAASRTFGFYVGGQKGTTFSVATSFFF